MSLLYNYNFGTECYCLDFSVNSSKPFFAAAFIDQTLRVWSLDDLQNAESTLDKPKFIHQGRGLGSVDVKINQLGNRVAVSTLDYILQIYNLHPESGLTPYEEIQKNDLYDIWKIDFNPSGNEIMTGTLSMKIFDVSTGNMTREFNKGSKFIQALAYSPNGQLCASGNIDGVVQLFDTRTYERKENFQNHGRAVRALKFSSNSQILVSAGEDLHINITDVEALKRKLTLTGHADWITCLSMSSTQKYFVTGSLDKQIKIWDQNSGKCIQSIQLSAPVWGAAFSPDGEKVATACQDGSISVYDLKVLSQ
ncbi:wd repeat domain 61 [Stylonychia lemnae]|uniref:Wd repeat domain 61 n=1 Tax=Stylonychia lemnae TaxID=5949 RepID=A0A078AWH5_STYLE|nr:wd repeat domain 61 [Stylonychia lemnae]|eukprot:CDW86504.1 wd repeat domain 61 [Stylonychia lemnae]